jgi:hypothetical protein
MDLFNAMINAALRPVVWGKPEWSLTILSGLAGVALLWLFSKASDQGKLRLVKRRIYALLLEIRIFTDEPSVAWRAHKALLGANLRYVGLALQPALLLGIPMAVLLVHLEGFYGVAPLRIGQDAIVTMKLSAIPAEGVPQLAVPPGIEITAPPVRILGSNEVSWRIRPTAPVDGQLRFTVDRRTIEKHITAGPARQVVSGRRVDSALAALWHPNEPRIETGGVQWIEVAYPDRSLQLFGYRIDWLLWFVAVSMITALLFKKPLGVTF